MYGVATLFLFQNGLLTAFYAGFFAGALGLYLVSRRYSAGGRAEGPTVRAMCLLFLLLVVGFAICISIFPYPDRPSIFFPPAFLMVAALFILPLPLTGAVLGLLAALFFVLVCAFKGPGAVGYDLFGGITVCPLAMLLAYLVLGLHIKNGEARLALREQSLTDPLTGLSNRRAVEQYMALNYRRCQQSGAAVAAIMADIDDFKAYNDTLGHLAGDACLRAMGAVFQTFAEEYGFLAARYGGEEFLFLLPDTDLETARAHAEELLHRIHACALPAPEGASRIAASLGVAAEAPAGQAGYTALIQRADEALYLYLAKAGGKDRVTVWLPAPTPPPA